MAFGTLVPAGLRGAGYDDQNNAYRNSDGVGKCGITGPSCETLSHGNKLKYEFNLQVFQMQVASEINKSNEGIMRCAKTD